MNRTNNLDRFGECHGVSPTCARQGSSTSGLGHDARHCQRRPAFTLIELLVVIGVLMFLFGLTVAFMPAIYQRSEATQGALQVQNMLAQARQRARRDKVPTGVLFLASDRAINPKPRYLDEMFFIQQPLDITAGETGRLSGAGKSNGVQIDGVDLSTVKPGDFLEINANGLPHLIIGVSGQGLRLGSNLPYDIKNCREFRIFRQPDLVQGENVQRLPSRVGIDIFVSSVDGQSDIYRAALQKNDARARKILGERYIDVVFTPSGALHSSWAGTSKLVLWVRDKSYTDPKEGSPGLVTVQVRTGFIAIHPVSYGLIPYEFCNDTRTSGL